MTRLSINDAARWTGAFLRGEWHLVAPVAVAFMALPGLAVQFLVPGAQALTGEMTRPQPWMGWLLPVIILGLIGALAISAMALVPRVSVGEALTAAATRLWVILVAWFCIIILLAIGVVLILAGVSFVGALLGASVQMLTGLGVVVSFAAMLVAGTRLLPMVPIVATEGLGPVQSVRRAWSLTRGHFWRLFAALILLAVAASILALAIGQMLGVAALLVGKAVGQEQLLLAIAAIIVNIIGAGLSAAFYVFISAIYRQLRD